MIITYKVYNDPRGSSLVKFIDGVFALGIAMDEDNTDYQEYLRWCEEGNEPEPADTGETQ
jgi:hypothetical protein